MIDTKIIKSPVITEKSLDLAKKNNTYTFLVDRDANKNQIKEAITELFKVDVLQINTVLSHRTFKTTGKKRMRTVVSPVKKALVTIKKDQKIDLYDFERGN